MIDVARAAAATTLIAIITSRAQSTSCTAHKLLAAAYLATPISNVADRALRAARRIVTVLRYFVLFCVAGAAATANY